MQGSTIYQISMNILARPLGLTSALKNELSKSPVSYTLPHKIHSEPYFISTNWILKNRVDSFVLCHLNINV